MHMYQNYSFFYISVFASKNFKNGSKKRHMHLYLHVEMSLRTEHVCASQVEVGSAFRGAQEVGALRVGA